MGDEYETSRFQCDLCGHSREGLLRCSACDENGDPVLAHANMCTTSWILVRKAHLIPSVTVIFVIDTKSER
ncbi:hypothetical protein COOONC_18138 [Cooperia oncophora]